MTSRTLAQYTGLLNCEEITQGINAARENSKNLLSDAQLLFNKERYATASSLAILAIEEAGKCSILRGLSACGTANEAKKYWKDYRNHRAKNAAWIIMDLAKGGAKTLNDLRECCNTEGEHTFLLNNLKQIGFYTDCLGDRNWSRPVEVINKEVCTSILRVAEVLCRDKEISVREIELWVESIKKYSYSKQALVNWHQAMLAEGLTDISAERHAAFLDAFD